MFKDNVIFNILYEIRVPEDATNQDLWHLKHCKDNEVRIVFFNLNQKTIALGKQQHDKCLDINSLIDNKVKVIRKHTRGTAVLFSGNEIIISVIFGRNTLVSNVPSVNQKNFMNIINDILVNDYLLDTEICDKGSRHEYLPAGCFNALTKNEIGYMGKKLVGGSFTKTNEKLFGHIMLYLDDSYKEFQEYIKCKNNDTVFPISLRELNVTTNINDFKQLLEKRLLNE